MNSRRSRSRIVSYYYIDTNTTTSISKYTSLINRYQYLRTTLAGNIGPVLIFTSQLKSGPLRPDWSRYRASNIIVALCPEK